MAIACIPIALSVFVASSMSLAGISDGANQSVIEEFINKHLQFLVYVIPFAVIMSCFVINANVRETMKNHNKSNFWLFWRFVLYQLRSIVALMIIGGLLIYLLRWLLFNF